jgi:hypothetical protein
VPNKTIYVKDEDLPLFDRFANEQESISSQFARFLRFEASMRDHRPQLTLMEPQMTLRDQFAMAAMQADAVQSALIAVAYTAQGKVFNDRMPDPIEAAQEHYKTADAMLEARK